MIPQLILITGDLAGERIKLKEDTPLVIGRDQSADLTLPEKKISRNHARVLWKVTFSEITIEDLDSLNGTYVNGEAVHGSRSLFHKDRIQIGSFLIEVDAPSVRRNADQEPPTQTKRASEAEVQEDFLSFARAKPKTRTDVFSEESTGGVILSGKLEELGLADLLQMLGQTRKTGCLMISKKRLSSQVPNTASNPGVAAIYLREGQILHATYSGLENEPVIYALLKWTRGYFSLFTHDHFDFENQMEIPTEALILEGLRLLDEEEARRPKIDEMDMFEIVLENPLAELPREELQMLQAVWKHKKYQKIRMNSPFDPEKTKALMTQLIEKGFVTKRSPS